MAGEAGRTELLGALLAFSNGAASPERREDLPYAVFGANGVIGRVNHFNAPEKTIIIGRVGSYCGCVHFSGERCWVTDNAILATAREPNDSAFIYYLLKSLDLNSWRTGSGQPLLTQSALSRIAVNVPPANEQRAIAHTLRTLDDKIELNHRMNETLEATCRALFDCWFVNFEPIRERMDGRTQNWVLSNLRLPVHFQESAIGKVPKDWEVTTLGSVVSEFETGSRPQGGATPSGIPSIGAESITGLGRYDFTKAKFVPLAYFNGMKKGHVKNRDVLLYKDGGRPGEFEPHVTMFGDGFPFDECAINEHVYRLRSDGRLSQTYLFFWLSSETALTEMRVKGTGVAIPGLNSTNALSIHVLVPPVDIRQRFDAFAEPLVAKVLLNCRQSRSLSALRDALLPKLLSGELRLKQVERAVAEVL